jgi:hypothetical protein
MGGNPSGDIDVMMADGSNVTKLTDGAHAYWPGGLFWLRYTARGHKLRFSVIPACFWRESRNPISVTH